MRMMVFFDLPVTTKAERRAYTLFRRFLLTDGYDMIQFSVYGRILNGGDAEEKHMKRLLANLPAQGSVRVLTVTEKQFASMKILVGLPQFQEKKDCVCSTRTRSAWKWKSWWSSGERRRKRTRKIDHERCLFRQVHLSELGSFIEKNGTSVELSNIYPI